MGTAGLLMAGKERGFLAKIRPELDRLVAVRFFMDQDLYDRVVAQAGEYLKIQAAGGKSPETLGHRLPVEIGVLRG
jgi:hypothetical protein